MKRLSNFFTLLVPMRSMSAVVQRSGCHPPTAPSISAIPRDASSGSTHSHESESGLLTPSSEGRQWIGSICVWCLQRGQGMMKGRGRRTTGTFRRNHSVHFLTVIRQARDTMIVAFAAV